MHLPIPLLSCNDQNMKTGFVFDVTNKLWLCPVVFIVI